MSKRSSRGGCTASASIAVLLSAMGDRIGDPLRPRTQEAAALAGDDPRRDGTETCKICHVGALVADGLTVLLVAVAVFQGMLIRATTI